MIIEFWTPFPGKSGCTANAIAFACTLAKHGKKVALLQLQFSGNFMERAFMDEKPGTYLQDLGIDSLFRTVKGGSADKSDIASGSLAYLGGKLSYFIPTLGTSIDIYQKTMNETLDKALEALNTAYEFVVVDIGAGQNKTVSIAIGRADTLVISLPQSRPALDLFVKAFKIQAKSLFFIIGAYDPASLVSLKSITHKSTTFNKHNTYFVEYDTNFKDALSSAKVPRFMSNPPKASKSFFKSLDNLYVTFMQYLSKEV